MNKIDPRALLGDIVGQRCERAANPHGSILSLDFGTLGRRQGDDAAAPTHGWRHLTVLSPWRLQNDHEILCDWNTDGGRNGTIASAIEKLVGQLAVAAHAAPPAWDATITWSNGLTLVIFGDSTDDRDDAWFILGTDGAEAGATPIVHGAN